MSSRVKKVKQTESNSGKKLIVSSDDESCGESNSLLDNNDKSEEESYAPTVAKSVLRGNAAALLGNLDDDDSDDDGPIMGFNKSKAIKPMNNRTNSNTANNVHSKTGIYSMKLNQFKQEAKKIEAHVKKFEENILENASKIPTKMDRKKHDSSDSGSSSSSSDESLVVPKNDPKSDIDSPPSPPPPPVVNKPKRKSHSLLEKQLKELESFKKPITLTDSILLDSDIYINESDIDIITVRVSTKDGLHKWDIGTNEEFMTIFKNLAKIENTKEENLVLMLKDRIIHFTDTPASVNLKTYDILDCSKSSIVHERIKVLKDDDDESNSENIPNNMIRIILQTQEGRKSRVKFLMSRDEPIANVLKKYCEVKGMADESGSYILEFDGDRVSNSDTPNELDLDGDEIFDVKKTNKTTLQIVNENKNNYEFDDDILIS